MLFPSLDKDECDDHTDWCTLHSTCMNTEGSYMCVCDDGYTKSGSQCVGQLLVYLLFVMSCYNFVIVVRFCGFWFGVGKFGELVSS